VVAPGMGSLTRGWRSCGAKPNDSEDFRGCEPIPAEVIPCNLERVESNAATRSAVTIHCCSLGPRPMKIPAEVRYWDAFMTRAAALTDWEVGLCHLRGSHPVAYDHVGHPQTDASNRTRTYRQKRRLLWSYTAAGYRLTASQADLHLIGVQHRQRSALLTLLWVAVSYSE
jgi:hypothetical protein